MLTIRRVLSSTSVINIEFVSEVSDEQFGSLPVPKVQTPVLVSYNGPSLGEQIPICALKFENLCQKTILVLRQKFSLNDQENFTKKFLVISRSWAAATATSKEIIVKATKPVKTNVKKPSTQWTICENREF